MISIILWLLLLIGCAVVVCYLVELLYFLINKSQGDVISFFGWKAILALWVYEEEVKEYPPKFYCKGTELRHDFEVVNKTTMDDILRNLKDIKRVTRHSDYYSLHVGDNRLTLAVRDIRHCFIIPSAIFSMHSLAVETDIEQKVCLRCGKRVDDILIIKNKLLSVINKKLEAIQTKEDRKETAKILWEDL